jgi:hypothetical protein
LRYCPTVRPNVIVAASPASRGAIWNACAVAVALPGTKVVPCVIVVDSARAGLTPIVTAKAATPAITRRERTVRTLKAQVTGGKSRDGGAAALKVLIMRHAHPAV